MSSRIPYFDVLNPVDAPAKVRVYRNLHKNNSDGGPAYSIQDARTRRVIAHVGSVTLTNVEFRVSQHGRERVLREKRKNVHAVVVGTPAVANPNLPDDAYYNPYAVSTFVDKSTQAPLHAVSEATIDSTGVHYRP